MSALETVPEVRSDLCPGDRPTHIDGSGNCRGASPAAQGYSAAGPDRDPALASARERLSSYLLDRTIWFRRVLPGVDAEPPVNSSGVLTTSTYPILNRTDSGQWR